MDIGTITRTDSGETGGLVDAQGDAKATEPDPPAYQQTNPVPMIAENAGRANGLSDEKAGAIPTEQDGEQDHETKPDFAKSSGDSDHTAQALPLQMGSLQFKNAERETSPSAADGLRGEMNAAFGDKNQSDDIEHQRRFSGVSLKLSTKSITKTPDMEKEIDSLALPPQNSNVLGYHSRSASENHGPDAHISKPVGVEEGALAPQLYKGSRPWDVAHNESIEYTQPSSMDSNIYNENTESASAPSVKKDSESSVDHDNPTAVDSLFRESTAKIPIDIAESPQSDSKRSSAISNYLATTTVFEELNPLSKKPLLIDKDANPSPHDEVAMNPSHEISLSGLGLDTQTIHEPQSGEIVRQSSVESNSSPTKPALPRPPRRRPPVPQTPPIIMPELTSPSSPPPQTPTSAVTASDLSSLASPSQRDSSTFNTASTVSSSEFPEVNTAASIQYSNTPTVATSLDIAATASVREQGQIRLRNLQSELAAAKARGDSKSQEDAIQRSIEVIWRTYLSPPTEPPTESSSPLSKSPSHKLKNRASILRLPSMGSSSKGLSLGNAAAAGDVTKLLTLLEDKTNVNSMSAESKTPLMRAAVNGHINCLEVLKAFGADELAVDKAGFTVLHHAVASNNVSAIKWLLESYPPPRPDIIRHRSSILLRATDAAKWGRTQKNLREASDTGGSKPLHLAVEKDIGGIVKTLLAAGVDIEAKNNYGRTPLHQAIITNRKDSFDTLLRNDAKIDALDGASLSPLHWAARSGQVSMIETLLEKGAARWEYDYAGNFPIHQAVCEGKLPALEALLTERSDLDRVTRFGETLLHISILRNHQNVAEYLLKNMVDINPWVARDPTWSSGPYAKLIGSSLTPLHYACSLGNFELAYLLLDKEAFINAPTPDGYTPLMMAVEAGNTDLVSLLHRRGAKLNASLPGNMMTALHMASKRGDLDTVRELCRAGANWKALAGKESYRRTPAQEADACTDKVKRLEVREYFHTIRTNELNKQRYNASVITPTPTPAAMVPASQPINYTPWVPQQMSNLPVQSYPPQTYPLQHSQAAPPAQWARAGAYMDDLMRPPMGHPQYFNPVAYETQVDSPPPYQPGTSVVSARLAAQPPVHRPKYS